MLKRTQQQFVNEVHEVNKGLVVVGTYVGVDYPVKVRCSKCGYEWEPLASNLLAGRGCRFCANRKTTQQFVAELREINSTITVKKIEVRCKTCDRIWMPTPSDLLQGHGCAICNRKKRISKKLHSIKKIDNNVQNKVEKHIASQYNIYRISSQ